MICQLLGVPYADHDFFQRTSRTLINRYTPADTAREARDEMLAYLDRLVERKLADPAQIPFKHDSVVYGVCELPVTW